MSLMQSTRLVVAAVQMRFRARVADNTEWICQTIQSSAEQGTDVVLFPECAVTGYNCDFTSVSKDEVESAMDTIRGAARKSRCNVLIGSPTWDGRRCLNSLV